MTINVDCGDCNDFVENIQRDLGDLLSRYDFHSVQCDSQRGGRECVWMLESERCRLLFTLSDGEDACSLGTVDTAFPGNESFLRNGEIGWYDTLWLIEFRTGKQLLDLKLINEFVAGKRVYFEWLSPLLDEWVVKLFGMFAGDGQLAWHDDFLQVRESRKPF